MIALFQTNTENVDMYVQQLVHANNSQLSVTFPTELGTVCFIYQLVCWSQVLIYTSLRYFKETVCFFILTRSETRQSGTLHFKTFNQTWFESKKIKRNFVSSGGMGGSLNQFYWGILVFDPPRFHSHPLCSLACAGNHRSSRMRYLPESFAEKKIIPLRQPLSFQFRHGCFRLRHESLFFHVEFHGRF